MKLETGHRDAASSGDPGTDEVRRSTWRGLLVAVGAGAFGLPLASFAQPWPPKVRRVGFLGNATASGYAAQVGALREGLRDLGYVEGKNIAIEYRWADEKYERLPELAAELVRNKVEVIVTHATAGTRAAMQATTTIPIVFAVVGDAQANGLVASLARPDGNVTGSSFFSPQLAAKRIELLKEALPHVRQIAVIYNENGTYRQNLDAMALSAKSNKVQLQNFGVRSANDFENAFAGMDKHRVEAVAIMEDATLIANAGRIANLAAMYRLPSIGFVQIAASGGLMGYGVNIAQMFRRAAFFVDKILKGSKVGDLPVERATKFDLVVNLKTAKALGISIPRAVLVRAEKVIE